MYYIYIYAPFDIIEGVIGLILYNLKKVGTTVSRLGISFNKALINM